jgi:hypothetical protein
MNNLEIVEVTGYSHDGLIIIDRRGAVWMTLDKPWWHPITWIRAFMPGRRVFLVLNTLHGRFRAKAIELNKTHIRMG